jgi:hypothetical protein
MEICNTRWIDEAFDLNCDFFSIVFGRNQIFGTQINRQINIPNSDLEWIMGDFPVCIL